MWEQIRGNPKFFEGRRGYEGYLNFDVAALPEVLQDNDYHTIVRALRTRRSSFQR